MLKQSIKDFTLFIKQWYRFVWSIEEIQKVKPEGCKDKKMKTNAFIKMCNVW